LKSSFHQLTPLTSIAIQLNYGPSTSKGLRKKQIAGEVDSFFDRHPSLVEVTTLRDVGDLENVLADTLNNLSRDEKVRAQKKASALASEPGELPTSSQAAPDNRYTAKVEDSQTDVNPWTLIETFKIRETEESKRNKQHMSELKKKKMAAALNAQVKLKEEAMRSEKAEDDTFVRLHQNSIKEWEEEQRLCAIKQKERTALLKKVRQDQIEASVVQRKEHIAATRAEELKEMQGIAKALAKEEEKKCMKRSKEREKWEHVKAENARKFEERRIRKEDEERMDAKFMADMKAKMDLEDAKRAKAVEDRANKLEASTQMLSEAGASEKREEILKFEQGFLKASHDREHAQVIEEKRKKDALKIKTRLINESNEKLIDEKKRKERAIVQEKDEYAAQWKREVETLQKEQEAKSIKQTETKLKYRQILKDQMEEHKRHLIGSDGMTSVERSMNKEILKEAQAFLGR